MSVVGTDGAVLAPRVMIAVPCGTMVHTDFSASLALLVGYTTYVKPDIELPLFTVQGTYLPRARAALVNAALERECTHLLWLDADMRFPKDALLRLLAHNVPLVGANYATRQMPIEPTAQGFEGEPVIGGEGLVDVKYCGMGVMLTETAVFRKIGKPYFAIGYNRAADDYAGEDTFFCEAARRHGFRVQVDARLSEEVEHCGALRYTMAHARLGIQTGIEAASAVEA